MFFVSVVCLCLGGVGGDLSARRGEGGINHSVNSIIFAAIMDPLKEGGCFATGIEVVCLLMRIWMINYENKNVVQDFVRTAAAAGSIFFL